MPRSQKKILVTGAIAFDHLFSYGASLLEQLREVTTLDVLSVSFEPSAYIKRLGGTGANIAWNLALLGGRPLLVGNVGPDGKDYVQILKKRGIDVACIDEKATSMTATGVCLSDPRAHQIWFFYRGADAVGHWPELTKKVASTIDYAIIGPRHYVQMLEGLAWCKTHKIPRLFDPGQEILRYTPQSLKRAINMSTGVIVNEFEWGMLKKRLKCTPEDLTKKVEYLIITKGEAGHVIYTKKGKKSFPRCNCEHPVDPTGAGDAFRAGLVLGITSGWSLDHASQLGAAIASFVVEEHGTHLDLLNLNHLRKRVKEAYGNSLPALPMD